MKKNGERCGVSSEDDNFRNASIQRFGCCGTLVEYSRSWMRGLTFVGTLLELSVVRSLLGDVENLLGQSLVCYWPCY